MAYTTVKALFTAICDAIREKTGKNGVINHEDIPEEIESIETGITPTGTKTIELNGTSNVAQYEKAAVSVQGGKSSYANPQPPFLAAVFTCKDDDLPTQADLYQLQAAPGTTYQRRCALAAVPAVGSLAAITGPVKGTTAEKFMVVGAVTSARAYADYLSISLTADSVVLGGRPDPALILTACGAGLDVRGRNTVTVTPRLYDTVIEENGDYSIPPGYDGFGDITVEVSGGGGDDDRLFEVVTLSDPEILYGKFDLDLSDLGDYTAPFTTVRPNIFSNQGGSATCDLRSVTFPSSVQTVGRNAFYGQNALEMVDLPGAIRGIGDSAFYGCDNLVHVDMGLHYASESEVILIGELAFSGCSKLALDALPDSAPLQIASQAFEYCSALAITKFPADHPIRIYKRAFHGSGICVKEIPANVDILTYSPTSAFASCPNLTVLKIKAAGIYRQVFNNCANMTKIWISSNCAKIDCAMASWGPFYSCTALTDIYCEAASQPSNWGPYFNATGASTTATVHWGVSEADFDAIIAE